MPFTGKVLKLKRKRRRKSKLVNFNKNNNEKFTRNKNSTMKKEVIQTDKTSGYIHNEFGYISRGQWTSPC